MGNPAKPQPSSYGSSSRGTLPATTTVCELFLAALIAVMVIAWAPLYVQWPRSGNHEHFASMALGWTRDLLPYRHLITINFPGEIYLFWILGHVCGWSS